MENKGYVFLTTHSQVCGWKEDVEKKLKLPTYILVDGNEVPCTFNIIETSGGNYVGQTYYVDLLINI